MSSNQLTTYTLNQYLVKLRPIVRQSQVHIVKHLIRSAEKIRARKVKTDDEKTKNHNRAERLINEVMALKGLRVDDISKCILVTKKSFSEVGSNGNSSCEERIIARLADYKIVSASVKEFKDTYPTWESDIPTLFKVLGLRHRRKKLKSLILKGKYDAYLKKENRILQLLHKIGGMNIDDKLLESSSFLTLDDIKLDPKAVRPKQGKDDSKQILKLDNRNKVNCQAKSKKHTKKSYEDIKNENDFTEENDNDNKISGAEDDPEQSSSEENNTDENVSVHEYNSEKYSTNKDTESENDSSDTEHDSDKTSAMQQQSNNNNIESPSVSKDLSKTILSQNKLKKKMKTKEKLLNSKKPKSEVKLNLPLLLNEGKSEVTLNTEEEANDLDDDFFVNKNSRKTTTSFFLGREPESDEDDDDNCNERSNADEAFDSSIYFRKRKYRDESKDTKKMHDHFNKQRKVDSNEYVRSKSKSDDNKPRRDFKKQKHEDNNNYRNKSNDRFDYNRDYSEFKAKDNYKPEHKPAPDLHPSWQAKKKANVGICSFQGSRVTFDD